VADITRSPGITTQIRLVAGLRWRLLRNSLRKKNSRLDLLGLIIGGFFGALFVLGLCFAFYFGAYTFLSSGRSAWIALLFWGIFLWWQLFPIFVAGFGASFEFRNLLRFPLSLGAFYIIGLAYGLADFGSVAAVFWLLAMTIGAAVAQPAVLPAMLLTVAIFLLMNVSLERLIGSWLERLLARRRTRELFFALFVLSMVSLQFIGPALDRYENTARPWVFRLFPYLSPLPASLAGRTIDAAVSGNFGGILVGTAGLALYVLLFSALLWRRFAAQYRGEELSETAAPVQVGPRTKSMEQTEQPEKLHLLSPQVAAVLRKEFRYLTRNGFAFLTLLLPPLLVALFSSQLARARTAAASQGISPDLFFPGMMAYLILILMAPSYNCFAYEGKGIQSYFMAPVRFREVFLGKNLMLVSVLAVEIGLSILVLAFRVGLPSAPIFVSTLAAIVFAVTGQLSIANWSSLSFPRKLDFGKMSGQRQSGMAVLVAFGAQIVLGGISALILFTGRWTNNPWLPAEAFAGLAAAALGGYLASLDALSQLAEKKKESLIEALCR
jgi:ABC-2 type transport system permease protein